MRFRHFSRMTVLAGLVSGLMAQEPLEPILGRTDLWQTSPPDISKELRTLHFDWTSTSQETARSVLPVMTFGGLPVTEALLQFEGGKLAGATLSYFNRGDSGELRDDQFDSLIARITENLNQKTGQEPTERGRDATSAVKASGRSWETPTGQYLLEWSAIKGSRSRMIPFRAEFVRLTIRPKGAVAVTRPADVSTREALRQFVGPKHVERLPDGDVRIQGIPMVDQGDKGYCVVASVERVMRYYGGRVDQHELAQIANSDAASGTTLRAMFGSLKRLTARLGVKSRSLYEWETKDILKTFEDYNRAAKRSNPNAQISLYDESVDADYALAKMDAQIFKEVRLKQKADFGKFQREIQRSIDEGIPLLWSVQLGIIKEKEIPQAFGGHMRLIVGYNASKNEILYSDCWGLGHELKRMSFDDAWVMTHALNSLLPIS